MTQGKKALIGLRLRLTLLATGLTGAVLVVMALACLSLAEHQMREGIQAAFESNLGAVTVKLQSDRVVSSDWLAQTETADRLVISISDAGNPLRFPGSWTPPTNRGKLIEGAWTGAMAQGVNPGAPPLSVIDVTRTSPFYVEGDHGERYLAAVALVPSHGGWQSVTLLRDMSAVGGQILRLRWVFALLTVVGAAVLFGLCWAFAGRAIRPIAESQQKQAEFIAAASHELRSPLAVIRTSVSAMGVDPGQTDRLRRSIDGECGRLARLVEDLLTLARSDAGNWSLQWETVDVDTLLLETAELFYPVASAKGLHLALQVPEEALPAVMGDAQRLRQAVTVLLDNAFCYTPEEGTVTLAAQEEGRWLVVRVSDTGPGIPPDQTERVFDRFYRSDRARSSKDHFGLGLSIARELAVLHRGSLTVTAAPGQGACFALRLPHR